VWSPGAVVSGTTISRLTLPVGLARNPNICTWLCSWISPTWLAGTRSAVTRMRPPAATVEGLIARVGPWAATAAHTPVTRSTTSTRMAAPAIIKERRRGFVSWPPAELRLVWAGAAGMAITIVAGARSRAGGGATAAAPAGTTVSPVGSGTVGRSTTVLSATAVAGAIFGILAVAGDARAVASALPNAVQLSQRAAGFFARPRFSNLATSR